MDPDPTNITEALMSLTESFLTPLQDLLDGQREDLRRREYSDFTIEAIIVETHAHILWLLRGSAT